MIPSTTTVLNAPVEEEQQPSLTWYMDFERGRIIGMADDIRALRQTVFQILQTDRFRYLIYSFDYGHEVSSLIGENPMLVESEVTRMITEALTQDDRINDVQNVHITMQGDSILVNFDVISIYSTFNMEMEVERNV